MMILCRVYGKVAILKGDNGTVLNIADTVNGLLDKKFFWFLSSNATQCHQILADEAMVLLEVTNTVVICLLGSDSYGVPSAQLQFGLGWESVVFR